MRRASMPLHRHRDDITASDIRVNCPSFLLVKRDRDNLRLLFYIKIELKDF